MSISKWADESRTPHLSLADRMIVIIYTLGITNKEQIAKVTGWDQGKIDEGIKQIRMKVKTPRWLIEEKKRLKKALKKEIELTDTEILRLKEKIEKETSQLEKERAKWIECWRPSGRNNPFVYALGVEGVKHACYMRQEYYNKYKKPPRAQVAHYMGINDILCRLIDAGAKVDTWLSTKEVQQEIFFKLKRLVERDSSPPAKPDALVEIDKKRYFLEYDAGTETNARLSDRFHNYLDLYDLLDEHLPVVWVTINEERKQVIEEVAKKTLEMYESASTPTMYCFVQSEETDFLMGKTEAKPFWEAD